MTEFNVQKRDNSGKGVARKLRAQGLIPGVCYGEGTEPFALIADPDALYKMLMGEYRTNIVFKLNVEGGNSLDTVMVRDYQIDPVRRELLHADFVSVDPAKELMVTVPIKTEGRPAGVRKGGRFQTIRDNVQVSCKPADIPPSIVLDVSGLDLSESVMADELTYPEGVKPAYKMNYTVCRVAVPRGAALADEEAPAEEETPAA